MTMATPRGEATGSAAIVFAQDVSPGPRDNCAQAIEDTEGQSDRGDKEVAVVTNGG